MKVLVFKTTLNDPLAVPRIKPKLDKLAGRGKWNFDLTDCDKILRITSHKVAAAQAIQLLNNLGIGCDELPD